MTARGLALLVASSALVALAAALPWLLTPALLLVGAAAMLVVADGRLAPGPERVRVSRECDRLLSLGVANPVRLLVHAPPGARLRLRDDAPDHMPASAQVLTMRGAGAVDYTLTPRSRGQASFGRVTVRATGPLRLGTRDFQAGQPLTARVDPNISAVRVYEALARRGQLEELGLRRLRRRGEGTDFERVRDAVPDDPLRFINWRGTARSGRLMTTELAPERDQPLIVCLDHGRLMGVGAGPLSKFDHAVNAAVLLAHVALRAGDRAGLFAYTDTVTAHLAPHRGSAQLARMLDVIAALEPGEIESDHAAALGALRHEQRRRALVAIFTDLVDRDQVATLITQCTLLRRRHLPLVITVRDPGLEDIARRRPTDDREVYARAVADGLISDREDALRLLRGNRVDVIDADPRSLSPRLVNRYLELKRRAAI